MTRLLITGCDVFDGSALRTGAAVRVDDGVVASVTSAAAATDDADRVIDLGGLLLAPGFIDLQTNGGGGVLFNDAPSVATLRTMFAAHRARGTTAFLPTLISDDAGVMTAGIAAVREALRTGMPGIAGIHLEGPHLNVAKRGVHDAARLRELDEAALSLLCSLDEGRTLVTLAPEVAGTDMIRRLAEAGVIVCAGHSMATYTEVRAAIGAGLAGFTHLFNAMSPLTSREPGMVGAALEDPETFVGVIADGFHVHPASLAVAMRAKPRGKMLLVTDAMPSVGGPASFDLHGERIEALDGCCVTADGTLAGSDIGMIDAVRYASGIAGIGLHEALRMASTYPAAALGLAATHGCIREGARADFVALDANLEVRRSFVGGEMEECA